MGEEAPSFSLVGTDTGFSSRSQDVFSSLATIEAKHGAFQKAATSTTRQRRDNEKLMKSDPRIEDALQRNKPNVFKSPSGFARPARKRAPDYRDHPERWTKYDLSDVPGDQMTERSNTAAAMDFLNAQRKRNEDNEDIDDASECTMIQFKKPTTKVSGQTSHAKRGSDTSDVAFGNSKLVMPEYVVGQSPSKKRQTSRVSGQVKCDAVDLGHLMHSEDQVEDEGDAQGMEDTMGDEQPHSHDVRSTSSAAKADERVSFKKISKSRASKKRVRTDDDDDDADNDD